MTVLAQLALFTVFLAIAWGFFRSRGGWRAGAAVALYAVTVAAADQSFLWPVVKFCELNDVAPWAALFSFVTVGGKSPFTASTRPSDPPGT